MNQTIKPKKDNQVTGNTGMYYICFILSKMGWNAMPTSRNAKGVDIIIYNQDCSKTFTIQVKTLSKKSPVPLGSKLDHLFADYVIVCNNVSTETPQCFILTPDEVKKIVHRGEKDGRISFWLQPKDYENEKFKESWNRIGDGN